MKKLYLTEEEYIAIAEYGKKGKSKMKAILISIRPQWVELILDLIKKTETRKGAAIGKAVNKLIEEQGFAPMFIYCTNQSPWIDWNKGVAKLNNGRGCVRSYKSLRNINGKVVACFYAIAEEIEKIPYTAGSHVYRTSLLGIDGLSKTSCLSLQELDDYLKGKNGTAIHICDLKIFDEPKALSEFYKVGHYEDINDYFTDEKRIDGKWCIPLKKAPQNYCYVEVEEELLDY